MDGRQGNNPKTKHISFLELAPNDAGAMVRLAKTVNMFRGKQLDSSALPSPALREAREANRGRRVEVGGGAVRERSVDRRLVALDGWFRRRVFI